MNDISYRIKYILKNEGLKQKELAAKLHASPQRIHNWISRNAISREAANQISEMFGYSLDWLLKGEGLPKKNRISEIPPMSEWIQVSPWDSKTPLDDDEVEIPYFKSIELAAGHGTFQQEDHNGYKLRFSKATLRKAGATACNVVAFAVHGDSMAPVIPDGATATVDLGNKTIADGAIYAIEQDDLFRLKLLYRMPGRKLSIRSYNRDEFPDEEADMADVKIIGRVIHWSVMAI
ncbi:helix-turn-helix transcriptional regulator [Salmonella enterica]|nr:helix-turn-helix transcriptional regulator [Salmonella enterica]EKA6116845.1 helix-turn-helix transcriptional regulator [Salmonella enterica]